MKRMALYLGFGLAPYLGTIFVDWGSANLATWDAGERFGLLCFTAIFLCIAAFIDMELR